MVSVKISDIWGPSVNVDPQHTKWFIEAWFHPDDLVTYGIIPLDPAEKTLWTTETARDLAEISQSTLQKHQDGISGLYGLYVMVNPVSERAELHVKGDNISSTRGGIKAVREIYGLFLDLDVKPGAFTSQQEAIGFVKGLDVQPTMIVRNGEGGIHAWYRATGTTKEDMKAFHAYAEDRAGVQIDRLINTDRVLRMPGGIRYGAFGHNPGLVEIIGGTGQHVDLRKIREISREAYAQRQVEDRKVRSSSKKTMDGSVGIAANVYWSNKEWADILTQAGWTFLRQDGDGRNLWARPGVHRKSATTDFQDGDHLSLLSSSEETGLADLKAAEVPLTKARVAMRLLANDDPTKMVEIIRNNTLRRIN